MSDDNEITLKDAADYIKPQITAAQASDNPPSEATLALDAMLAASRKGKTVKANG